MMSSRWVSTTWSHTRCDACGYEFPPDAHDPQLSSLTPESISVGMRVVPMPGPWHDCVPPGGRRADVEGCYGKVAEICGEELWTPERWTTCVRVDWLGRTGGREVAEFLIWRLWFDPGELTVID